MAKPNPKCPECHGTGWALKPGTQTQSPCKGCAIRERTSAYDALHYEPVVDEQEADADFTELPSHGW